MVVKDRIEKKNIIIVLFLSILLGIISLLLNLQTIDELNTQAAPIGLAIRIALSYIFNGATWAILLIFSGMMTQKWWQSILLSLISAFVALSIHYGLGIAIGYFDELGDNIVWYIKAMPLAIILGLIGYFSQLNNSIGNILKMIIPAFLIIGPFSLGRFTTYWYNRPVVNLANNIAAWLELSIGVLTVILFLFVFRKEKNAKSNV